MEQFQINHLLSGGLITNYHCTSRCGHCLYACAPGRAKDYIDRSVAEEVLQKMKSLGCYHIHIGGGEPMLDVPRLLDLVDAARHLGMGIQYVETNASWYQDQRQAMDVLDQLRSYGIRQLLISMSPFHNERIPFYQVKGLIQACKLSGIQPLPWVMDFYDDMEAFDDQTKHSLDEYVRRFGDQYIQEIPSRYWIHLGGRAVFTFQHHFPLSSLNSVLHNSPCRELADTSHFHIDLYGNYIPGLCSGFAIEMEDLGKPLDENKYPFLSMLYQKGIDGLYQYAREKYGFKPQQAYLNKCHLCNDIRLFLVRRQKLDFQELKPAGYYRYVDQVDLVSQKNQKG